MKEVLALLDHALLGLRGVTDAKIKIRDAEREIAAALFHTYRALASSGDAGAFDRETASALGRARDALKTLQEVETADRATATEMSVIAHAVRLLAENPAPPDPAPFLPKQGRATAVLLATKGEPQLLDLRLFRPLPDRPALSLAGGGAGRGPLPRLPRPRPPRWQRTRTSRPFSPRARRRSAR